jgi:hypothetical protein
MRTSTTRPATYNFRFDKLFIGAIIFILILMAGLITLHSLGIPASHTTIPPISQSALEAKYGLRVSLIAVTAAGGKVDLRMKMVDSVKARLLLQDSKNFPSLVTSRGVVLSVPADEKPEGLEFKDGTDIFLLFPNTRGVLQPGMSVSLMFGETKLEPIVVK